MCQEAPSTVGINVIRKQATMAWSTRSRRHASSGIAFRSPFATTSSRWPWNSRKNRLDNLTPADVYFGRVEEVKDKREEIKQKTMKQRRQLNRQMAPDALSLEW